MTETIDQTGAVLRGMLARDAVRLAAGRRLPLDLTAVLRELGVGLATEPPAGPAAAHGTLRQSGRTWEIVVNESLSPARQRSTVAHELGHYLVEARIGYRPTTISEYWMLEEQCQSFAASLLSPGTAVSDAITPRPREASGLFDSLDRLIEATGLSLEAAARRIVDSMDVPTLLAAAEPTGGAGTGRRSEGTLVWLYANRPWAMARRGQRVGRGHAAWPALLAARGLPVGERAVVELADFPVHVQRRTANFVLLAALP